MTTCDQIADKLVTWLGARTLLSTGTREELRKLVASEFAAVAPQQQASLSFADQEALKGQSAAILKLLTQRRSQGAFNYELAELSLKYTSRISDLRAAGWKIECTHEQGRTRLYHLVPSDW